MALRHADPQADIRIISDASYFVDGWRDGRHTKPQPTNGDLWREIGRLCSDRCGDTDVDKVVSHMSAEDIIHTATPSDWVLGNALAVAFAGEALAWSPLATAQ